jgi:ATP synthase protein I
MTESPLPQPPDDLQKRIKLAREKNEGGAAKEQSAASSAFQVSTDLLSGVAVGMFIGYFLDKWLDTKPILFIICFFFGAIAGGYNIYRSVQKDDAEPDNN